MVPLYVHVIMHMSSSLAIACMHPHCMVALSGILPTGKDPFAVNGHVDWLESQR